MYRLFIAVAIGALFITGCGKDHKTTPAQGMTDETYYTVYEAVAKTMIRCESMQDTELCKQLESVYATYGITADEFREYGSELLARDKDGFVNRTQAIDARLKSADNG